MRNTLTLVSVLVVFLGGALATRVSAQQGESPDEMREANKAAALLLSERLRRDRPADYELFCGIRRADVLVVGGQYDHIEWVLRDLGVPFAVTSPEAFPRRSLRGIRAILVNCPGRIGGAGARRLRTFVAGGGFLFTTDWCVLHILETAFPGTIRYTQRPTRDDVVSIRVLDPPHRYLQNVLTGRDRHLWWLEDRSYPFEIVSRRVEVLIDSEELLRKYGAKPVAVTFRHGRGRVVHIISHSYLQRGELRTERDRLAAPAFAGDLGFDEDSEPVKRLGAAGLARVPSGQLRSAYSAQQFLANFLIDAVKTADPGPVEPEPRPEPPDPRPPVVRPAGAGVPLSSETRLCDRPSGTPLKLLAKGLKVVVLVRRHGWARVSTPAGELGWVPETAISE